MMDFSMFRDSGELSDTTVIVNDVEFKLHKFPLYIKSDFFRALARNPPKEKIELTDFPGGAEVFEMVANFCYNMKINITKENVCPLRCAAEFLQMNSRGNLAELSDRFLTDTLTSAKLGRHLGCITDLVMQCDKLGPIAEQAGVISKCLNAICDCWLLSNKFTKRLPFERLSENLTEREVYERIAKFPLDWLIKLIQITKDKNVRPHILAELAQTYINLSLEKHCGRNPIAEEDVQEVEKAEAEEEAKTDETDNENGSDKVSEQSNQDGENGEKEEDTKDNEDDYDNDDDKTKDQSETASKTSDKTEEELKPISISDLDDTTKEELKQMLDQIINELPNTVLFADLLDHRWCIEVLNIAEELHCECCPLLRALIGKMLHRFNPKELMNLPASLLTEIITETSTNGRPDQQRLLSSVIDVYLLEMVNTGELNVDTFTKMIQAVPEDTRINHDTLFQVMEALLKSDKINMTEEEKSNLLESIDFGRLSESTLQRAYESQLVPQTYISKAALKLCFRLRSDLDSAQAIIKAQEQELRRYGIPQSSTSHYVKHPRPVSSRFLPSESRHSYSAPGITYTYPSGTISCLSSDLELQLALDSMDSRDPYDFGHTYSSSFTDTEKYYARKHYT